MFLTQRSTNKLINAFTKPIVLVIKFFMLDKHSFRGVSRLDINKFPSLLQARCNCRKWSAAGQVWPKWVISREQAISSFKIFRKDGSLHDLRHLHYIAVRACMPCASNFNWIINACCWLVEKLSPNIVLLGWYFKDIYHRLLCNETPQGARERYNFVYSGENTLPQLENMSWPSWTSSVKPWQLRMNYSHLYDHVDSVKMRMSHVDNSVIA